MQISHITANSGHVAMRDTNDILPQTVLHFKDFQISSGAISATIAQTPLECRLTVECEACLFTFYLIEDSDPLVTCIGCFSEKGKSTAKHILQSLHLSIEPKENLWLINAIIKIDAPFEVMQLIGEISFYIYNSVRISLIN